VAHVLPASNEPRLVIDIGGGSTEFIIGRGLTPERLESLNVGCVGMTQRFFAGGSLRAEAFADADMHARAEIEAISAGFTHAFWREAYASSGTALALADILEQNGLSAGGITREGLLRLRKRMVAAGHLDRLHLPGLKPARAPVLAGGFAIMLAALAELDVPRINPVGGALRLGVLYDLLGRSHHEDMRTVTVDQFMRRYGVDRAHASRVRRAAQTLLSQFPEPTHERREDNLALLGWAASLHEIGMSISHSGYHKHSAYIATHADMPGFSKTDQARLATLLLGHAGKLGKLSGSGKFVDWRMLFSLRLAFVLCRRRSEVALPDIRVSQLAEALDEGFTVRLPKAWIDANPLIEYSLAQEADEWQRIGKRYKVIYD
jgi:exopolyphosphatase/guanosine-5'-triphosphate,3'-diphosphate pyrophosphatase